MAELDSPLAAITNHAHTIDRGRNNDAGAKTSEHGRGTGTRSPPVSCWRRQSRPPRYQYARAREEQADRCFQEIIDIADNTTPEHSGFREGFRKGSP
jgi:hypothetical protein